MQSKELTARTNEAKRYRKELKPIHPEWKMFISHPAKLKTRKKTNYELLKRLFNERLMIYIYIVLVRSQ